MRKKNDYKNSNNIFNDLTALDEWTVLVVGVEKRLLLLQLWLVAVAVVMVRAVRHGAIFHIRIGQKHARVVVGHETCSIGRRTNQGTATLWTFPRRR